MSQKIMRLGRPSGGAAAETAKVIHVGLDQATWELLDRMEREMVGPKRGRRSAVVRKALHLAASRSK